MRPVRILIAQPIELRRRRFVIGGAMLLLALALPAAAMSRHSSGPNLIQNGGFEQPSVGTGGYKLVATGQSFAGWKVVGATGNVAPISTTFQQSGINFVAKAGKQWVDLTGLSNSATGVAQVVKTQAGATYTLSFAVGNVSDPGGVFGTRSTVNVFANGHKLLAATNTGGGKTQGWKSFTLKLKATSASTTIQLLNGDSASDSDNGLDAVSLTKR